MELKSFIYCIKMNISQETVDFILPANSISLAFLQLSLQDKLHVIELGIKFLKSGKHQQQLWNNAEWLAKLNTQKEEQEKEIQLLQQQLDFEQIKQQQLIIEQQSTLEITRKSIKEHIDVLYRSEIEDLKQKLERLENKLQIKNMENQTLYQQAYQDFEKRLTEKEDKWNTKMDKLRSDYENKLTTEKLEKENYIIRAQNSTLKGQVGEKCILHELNRRFPKADIEDTHKKKGRGDFVLKENAFGMLIEIKNYTKNVPKNEIDKFYKDMNTNHDIQCGVLISLESGVCAKGDFHLEVTDGKPILFLHHMAQNMFHIELAVQLFKLILKSDSIDLSCKEMTGKIKNSIPIIKRNWNKIRQKILKFNKEITDCVSEQEGIIRSIFELINLRY